LFYRYVNRMVVRRDGSKGDPSDSRSTAKRWRTETMASQAKQNSEMKRRSAENPRPANSALSENELARVAGGFNPQPDPPADLAPRFVSLPAEKLLQRH
jgi:hypothetical protein